MNHYVMNYLPQYSYMNKAILLIIYVTVEFVNLGLCAPWDQSCHKCTNYQGILVLQISLAI